MPTTLPPAIFDQVQTHLRAAILSVHFAGGGDINDARLLETAKGHFFIKMNRGQQALQMFETEAKGLQLLASTQAIRIPKPITWDNTPDGAFLLLEYIETGHRDQHFWENFGTALANLHRHSAPFFGLDHDNFIGSLPQSNRRHDKWPEFFIRERLQPQLELALQQGQLYRPDEQAFGKLFQQIPSLCPQEPPALIHGDLWNGNFLCDAAGRPVLIDPSAAYAHREMDLAMSRLFGGFDRPFYDSYQESFPLEPGFERRLPLFQLYYLLVHVNLFGGGYVGSVRNVVKGYV